MKNKKKANLKKITPQPSSSQQNNKSKVNNKRTKQINKKKIKKSIGKRKIQSRINYRKNKKLKMQQFKGIFKNNPTDIRINNMYPLQPINNIMRPSNSIPIVVLDDTVDDVILLDDTIHETTSDDFIMLEDDVENCQSSETEKKDNVPVSNEITTEEVENSEDSKSVKVDDFDILPDFIPVGSYQNDVKSDKSSSIDKKCTIPSTSIDLTNNDGWIDPVVDVDLTKSDDLNLKRKKKKTNTSSMISTNIRSNYLLQPPQNTGLRRIFIDASNVAFLATCKGNFCVERLKMCIDYFLERGHKVQAILPCYRKQLSESSNQKLLLYLEEQDLLIFTPSRQVGNKRIICYDDRYILQLACKFDGIIVTSDNFRDLSREDPAWKRVIENNILPFTWVDEFIIFPIDPLGKFGPHLSTFLRYN